MKTGFRFSALPALLLALLLLAGTTRLLAQEAPGTELRGAWIHAPQGISGWGWDATVKALADNGFNALFANLSWTASSDYPSQVSSHHPSLKQKDGSTRDLLQECLDACRKYGVQLHVWVVVCNMGEHTPAAVKKRYQDAGRTQLDKDGNQSDYLAPQIPENRKLLQDVVVEIARKYPEVSGIHLDYIRYPLGDYDCSPRARKDFEMSLGRAVPSWPVDVLPGGALRKEYRQWCRQNVTELVRAARQALRAASPRTALSAATYGWEEGAMESVAQDANQWVREGLIDFLCPMNYSGKPQEPAGWLAVQQQRVAGRIPIYSGLANYMCESVEVLRQEIRDARALGAEGFICFQLKEPFARDWLPEIGKNETAAKAPAPQNWGVPRPQWSWQGGVWHDPPWYFFWQDAGWTPLVCQAVFLTRVPVERQRRMHPVLALDGVERPASAREISVEWLDEYTLRLSFAPEKPGGYQWTLVESDFDPQDPAKTRLWRSSSFVWKAKK